MSLPVSNDLQVTLAFWIIKILVTTVGETGGGALSMSLQLGCAVSSVIFLVFFATTLIAQVTSRRYRPFVYWAIVIATTTLGNRYDDDRGCITGRRFDKRYEYL